MFNFFPKPFGLDISDCSIEIVSLSGLVENPKLQAMGGVLLDSGTFQDGQILNKENLKKTLKNLIKNPQFGKIKTNKIIFALSESKSYIHIFELPEGLKEIEILEFVKSQIRQTLPFSLAELYFDYQIFDKEVLLVAAPKKIVNDYLEIFESCNLKPLVLEIESMSLGRALIGNIDSPILLADIGARTTNFSVFDEGKLRLSISVPVAGDKFTRSLSEKLNIPEEEAENLKKEIGLKLELREGRIFLIIQKDIQEIIKEIEKIDNYFQKKIGKSIKKIILAGGSAILPHLSEYLSESLQKPVDIGDPWVKINIDILRKKEYFREALKINPILYSTVIGLALRGLEKNPKTAGINLIGGLAS